MALKVWNDEVCLAANADGQFRHAARMWTCVLLLKVGDDRYVLKIVDGEMRRFELTTDQFQAYDVTLGGSEDDWQQLLASVPVPFYQDFLGAWFNHGFELAGDLRSVFTHYWALLRLLDLMRSIRTEKGGRA